jgi:3D (Asp-Asp-Asp) domain-containing protein
MHRDTVQSNARRSWRTHIRISLAFTLLLTFGFTLTLPAQNHPPSPIHTVQVTLRVAGEERQITVPEGTVESLLEHEKVVLNPHDRVTPSPDTKLEDGISVRVERVTFEILDEKVAIPPPVVTRWDSRMTSKPVVIQQGKPGVATQKRCIWRKDGEISVQWTQSRKVLVQPTPTIVRRGKQPSRGGRILSMVATAYDPSPASCGKYASGRTAIGLKATKGVIAVDPKVIPLGTRVFVEGYGPAIAGDVGGAIKGNKIDVCFPTRREALQWGRRTVKVTIYD